MDKTFSSTVDKNRNAPIYAALHYASPCSKRSSSFSSEGFSDTSELSTNCTCGQLARLAENNGECKCGFFDWSQNHIVAESGAYMIGLLSYPVARGDHHPKQATASSSSSPSEAFVSPTFCDMPPDSSSTYSSPVSELSNGYVASTIATQLESLPPRSEHPSLVPGFQFEVLRLTRELITQATAAAKRRIDESLDGLFQSSYPPLKRLKFARSESEAEHESPSTLTLDLVPSSQLATHPNMDELLSVPTAPSTPVAPNGLHVGSSNPLQRTAAFRKRSIPKIPSVPTIAPPSLFSLPSASAPKKSKGEDAAKDRIRILVGKQIEERINDGLHGNIRPTPLSLEVESSSDTDDEEDDWGPKLSSVERRALQVELANATSTTWSWEEHFDRTAVHEKWSRLLGIEDNFRRVIIEWFSVVRAPEPALRPLTEDDRYNGERSGSRLGLIDQLDSSPETRFHAGYIFLRYLLRVVNQGRIHRGSEIIQETTDDIESDIRKEDFTRQEQLTSVNTETITDCDDMADPSTSETSEESVALALATMQEGKETVVWDLALGCMALSVKLHRDCLPPLQRIKVSDFLSLSTHCTLLHEFEEAQEDIMSAFEYHLGIVTPQSFLDELWVALPAMRDAVLASQLVWEEVERATWDVLMEAIREPDVLRFPIPVLTTAALTRGFTNVIASLYEDLDQEAQAITEVLETHDFPADSEDERVAANRLYDIWKSCESMATRTVEASVWVTQAKNL